MNLLIDRTDEDDENYKFTVMDHYGWDNYVSEYTKDRYKSLVTILAADWPSPDCLKLTIRHLALPYINKDDLEEVSEEVYKDESLTLELNAQSSHHIKDMSGCNLKQIRRQFNEV